MQTMFFALNKYFTIDASLNLLIDNETGAQTKLEPRLMEILCILVKHEGKLVSRETLISEVWNDYGGAEDGLNQGISFLRKALADTNKEIIQTVPKKGYILHATATTANNSEKPLKKKWFYLATLGCIFILLSITLLSLNKNKLPEKLAKQPDSLLRSDVIASENWHGKHYKLAFDQRKKVMLFENNIQIADRDLINFEIVIQELKDKMISEQDAKR